MKKLRFGIFGLVSLLSFISFGYCDNIIFPHNIDKSITVRSNAPGEGVCGGLCCFSSTSSNYVYRGAVLFNGVSQLLPNSLNTDGISCVQYSGSFTLTTTSNAVTLYMYDISDAIPFSSCPDCPTCSVNSCIMSVSQDGMIDNYYYTGNEGGFTVFLDDDISYTSGLSYGGYPNITVSPICSYTGGGIDTSGLEWSALYINDIQHLGAGLINLTIPEEFDWDYLYTGNGDVLDIDIKGYNVDTEYIDGIITTQKTLPNKVDFNNTISGLLPGFVPGLVIILFLYFVFRFLKKIF